MAAPKVHTLIYRVAIPASGIGWCVGRGSWWVVLHAIALLGGLEYVTRERSSRSREVPAVDPLKD